MTSLAEHVELPRTTSAAGADLLQAVAQLEPLIRERSQEIEETRLIAPEIISALYETGVFRSFLPRVLGGLELAPIEWLEVVEALARINGSVGWLAMICAGHTFIPEEPMSEMLADGARWIPAMSGARVGGQARRVPGGYQVSGRWPWCSSGPYADFAGGMSFLIGDDGEIVIHPKDGMPWVVNGVVPKDQFTYVDTWDGLGLRGTGSGDIQIEEVFIPESHTMQSLAHQPYDGPIYRAVMLFQIAGHAAHALGIARAAVDSFIEIANRVPATGSMRQATIGRQQYHQIAVARADALIRSARLFSWDSVAKAYQAALDLAPGEKIPLELRVLMRESTTFAVRNAKQAVNLMFEITGSAAVKKGTAMEVAYRDVSTAAQHLMHVEETLSLSGQYWLTKDRADGPEIEGGLIAFF